MKKLLGLLLLVCSFAAQAAAPVISCTPSRTSGTAPLGVTWDCTATTDADTAKPFHDLLYIWSFGDPSSGKWANGANTNLSKNFATGAVAGHVYETAGTYTWRIQVSDGTTTKTSSGTITVADPDTTYAGTATVCFFNTAVGTGCPAGATQTASSPGDFDAALASCIGTTKRCLFKRGDTFASSTTGTVANAGPNTIGAYGSGALPIITSTNIGGVLNITNAAVNDLRIMDLEIIGSGASDTGVCVSVAAAVTNVVMLRVSCHEIGKGFVVQSGSKITGSILQDNHIYNYYSASGGNAYFGSANTSAFLGNLFGPAGSTAEHVFRLQPGVKVVSASNTFTTPAATKMVYTLRAGDHVAGVCGADVADSQYVVSSADKLVGGVFAWTMQIAPAADTQSNFICDVIVDGDWFTTDAGSSATTGIIATAQRLTIRNTLFDFTGTSGSTVSVSPNYTNTATPAVPMTDDVLIVNTTTYNPTASVAVRGIFVTPGAAGPTNTNGKNNLIYAPGASATGDMLLCQGGGEACATITTSSSDGQITGTNPSFDGPLSAPKGFRIGTGSYAATGGTALFPSSRRDFFNCDDLTANEHIGAFVPRTRAQCIGGVR